METILFELNGQNLEALVGESILQAADRAGVSRGQRRQLDSSELGRVR